MALCSMSCELKGLITVFDAILMDVAWLVDAQLIFLLFHTFISNLFL